MTYRFFEAQEDQFDRIWEIASEAFPANELRTREKLYDTFVNNPHSKVYCLCEDTREKMVEAFIVVWDLDDIAFIEYFAVSAHQRGKGLGGVLLDWTIENCGKLVVLEVEPPEDTMTKRRIRFYEGHGFILNDSIDYRMPPSREGMSPVPLRIMSYPKPLERSGFPALRSTIYRRVYNRPDFI